MSLIRPVVLLAVAVSTSGCGLLIGAGDDAPATRDDAGAADASADVVEGADASSGDAAAGDACVAGEELCNGVDDDCDGARDESCPCDTATIVVTETPISTPSLVWADGHYAIAWQDYRDGAAADIFFARYDAAARPLGGHVRLSSTAADSVLVVMAWNGIEHGLAWIESGVGLVFQRVAADGTPIGEPTGVAPGAVAFASIAWHGGLWAIAYETPDGIRLREIAPDGTPASSARTLNVRTDGAPFAPFVVSAGTELAIAWTVGAAAETRFQASAGTSAEVDISGARTASLSLPQLAWSGTDVVATWWTRSGEVFMTRSTDTGPVSVQVSPAGIPCDDSAVGATRDRIVVAFERMVTTGTNLDVVFLTPEGTTTGSVAVSAGDVSESDEPVLAWSGGALGIAWEEGNDGARGVRFQVLCPR